MPRRKTIYPVFLPHAGCPFQCVYCNQNAVTSNETAPIPDLVKFAGEGLALHAKRVRESGNRGEVAFYGGTFTALPPGVLSSILVRAAAFVDEGVFTGIRFSTRPDCLGREIFEILEKFPVTTVELGVQSLSDEVLRATCRGYSAKTAIDAAIRVKGQGWDLGIQLMVGLPVISVFS